MSGNLQTIVGIDEAGYGPRLGPLVVGLTAFRAPAPPPELEELLPAARERSSPIPIRDSKRIYSGGKGLNVLERVVLAFRDLAGEADVPDRPEDRPAWAPAGSGAEPVAATEEELTSAREALAAAVRQGGVTPFAIRTRTVGVREFNRETERLGSKAAVLFSAAMELLEPYLSIDGPLSVVIDRHGGRTYYSSLLSERFPHRYHWVVGESRDASTYRFPRDGEDATVSFQVKGDDRHLPVALASMAAKYVRELHMGAFNRYFGGAQPALAPTAGYAVDGTRWLDDTEDLRRRLGVADEDLIRIR